MRNPFDAHRHFIPGASGPPAGGVFPSRGPGAAGRVLCAIAEEDWAGVIRAAGEWPGTIPAVGVHPWTAGEARPGWPERLERILLDNPAAWTGETGLDRLKGDFSVQKTAFSIQLALASRLRRSLAVHCVGAEEDVLRLMRAAPPGTPFVMHSFSGSGNGMRALAEMGAYFSVGPAAADARFRRLRRLVPLIPPDRLLVESDAFLPFGADSPDALTLAANAVADLRGERRDLTLERLEANAAALTGNVAGGRS